MTTRAELVAEELKVKTSDLNWLVTRLLYAAQDIDWYAKKNLTQEEQERFWRLLRPFNCRPYEMYENACKVFVPADYVILTNGMPARVSLSDYEDDLSQATLTLTISYVTGPPSRKTIVVTQEDIKSWKWVTPETAQQVLRVNEEEIIPAKG